MNAFGALRSIWLQAGLPEEALSGAQLPGADPVLPSSFAVGTASQSSRLFFACAAAAKSPTGWIVPTSLFTSIVTTMPPSGINASSGGSASPAPSTGRVVAFSRSRHCSEAACSMLRPATPPGIASAPRSSAQLSASVAPEVKKTRPPLGNSAAT